MQKSTYIKEKILPSNHPSLATSFANLAMSYENIGDSNRALDFAIKSTIIQEKILPVDSQLDFALSYNNLAHIYHKLGNLEKASEFAIKSIDIKERISFCKSFKYSSFL